MFLFFYAVFFCFVCLFEGFGRWASKTVFFQIAQIEIDELHRRYDEFSKRTGILAASAPNLSEEIANRLKSIRLQLNELMESAQTKRSGTSCSTADAGMNERKSFFLLFFYLFNGLRNDNFTF